MKTFVWLLLFMASTAVCLTLNSESDTKDVKRFAAKCYDAISDMQNYNMYYRFIFLNENITNVPIQMKGQMCIAAAMRHNLEINDVSDGMFTGSTSKDILRAIEGKLDNPELRDLQLDASRTSIITGKAGTRGRASILLHHYDYICSSPDDCESKIQMYCTLFSNRTYYNFTRSSAYDLGIASKAVGYECWARHHIVPLYKQVKNNSFVDNGFPLFGNVDVAGNARMAVVSKLGLTTSNANAKAEYVTYHSDESFGTLHVVSYTRPVINSTNSCPINIINYDTDYYSITNGPFPYVIEENRDGVCLMGKNENMLSYFGTRVASLYNATRDQYPNIYPIGSTSEVGYCNRDSRIIVRGKIEWNRAVTRRSTSAGSSDLDVVFSSYPVNPRVCPRYVYDGRISYGDTVSGICLQYYCGEVTFNPNTGFPVTISNRTLYKLPRVYPIEGNISWPRDQEADPCPGYRDCYNSTDGIICNTDISTMVPLIECIEECAKTTSLQVSQNEINGCIPSSECENIINETIAYDYNIRRLALDGFLYKNQTQVNTETYRAVSYGAGTLGLDGKYSVSRQTRVSNTGIAYGMQAGSAYSSDSCWINFNFADANDIYTSNVSTLVSATINVTSSPITQQTTIYINRCIENLVYEANNDPAAATVITAANTAGTSIFSLLAILIAVIAKEYEEKLHPAIRFRFRIADRSQRILLSILVGIIITTYIAVGVLPVCATLVQEVRLANKDRMGQYITDLEILPTGDLDINTLVKSRTVIHCVVRVPPPHYRAITGVMITILIGWIVLFVAVLANLIRRCF